MLETTKNIFPQCKIFTDNKILDKRDYRVSSKKLKDHLNFEAKKTVIDGLNELKIIFEKKEILDAKEKLDAGADLVQIYSGLIYEGPMLVRKINEAILKR